MNATFFEFTENTRYVKRDNSYSYPYIVSRKGYCYQTDYYTMRMPEHVYANCEILHYYNGDVALRSYSTIVAYVTCNGFISCSGTYSRTTIKHLGYFAEYINEEFNPCISINYYTFKCCYERDDIYNLYTGERVEL